MPKTLLVLDPITDRTATLRAPLQQRPFAARSLLAQRRTCYLPQRYWNSLGWLRKGFLWFDGLGIDRYIARQLPAIALGFYAVFCPTENLSDFGGGHSTREFPELGYFLFGPEVCVWQCLLPFSLYFTIALDFFGNGQSDSLMFLFLCNILKPSLTGRITIFDKSQCGESRISGIRVQTYS
jgi:hypothetical protein